MCYDPENTDSIETVKKVLQTSTLKTTVAFAIKEDILKAIKVYFTQSSFYEMETEVEMVKEEEEVEALLLLIVRLFSWLIV